MSVDIDIGRVMGVVLGGGGGTRALSLGLHRGWDLEDGGLMAWKERAGREGREKCSGAAERGRKARFGHAGVARREVRRLRQRSSTAAV